MQMMSICVCLPYADGRHMDMFNLCAVLSFFAQIRKKAVPDLPPTRLRAAAQKHNMRHSFNCIFFYMLCSSLFP